MIDWLQVALWTAGGAAIGFLICILIMDAQEDAAKTRAQVPVVEGQTYCWPCDLIASARQEDDHERYVGTPKLCAVHEQRAREMARKFGVKFQG